MNTYISHKYENFKNTPRDSQIGLRLERSTPLMILQCVHIVNNLNHGPYVNMVKVWIKVGN